MSKRNIGIVLIVVGVLAVIVSLGADAMGLGAAPGLGWKQALGAVVGMLIVAVGAWFWPGFPESRLIADAPGSRRPVPSAPTRKSGAAKKPQAAKKTRSSRRRRK
jgi:cytochrome c biogenesis protein CcdA